MSSSGGLTGGVTPFPLITENFYVFLNKIGIFSGILLQKMYLQPPPHNYDTLQKKFGTHPSMLVDSGHH
jgi:hypothetical protein